MQSGYPFPMTGLKQDWRRIAAELDEQGWAVLPALLESAACAATAMLYDLSLIHI